jgi:hypothetical protein
MSNNQSCSKCSKKMDFVWVERNMAKWKFCLYLCVFKRSMCFINQTVLFVNSAMIYINRAVIYK